jgi:predicted ester cyclase
VSEANKMVVRRLLELYNDADWDGLEDVMSADYVHHNNGASMTLAQFKRGAAWVRAGIPDFQIEIEDLVAEGDKVAARGVGRGTHLGSMFGEAPTSRAIALHIAMIYRLQDGRIMEDWEAMDEYDLRSQIGALAPEG